MSFERVHVDPFTIISEEWHVGRGKAPATWFSKRFPLKKQKSDEGCSKVMARVAYLLNKCRQIEEDQVDDYMDVGKEGIDPKPLARGLRRMGIDCEEYLGAKTDDLIRVLSDGSTVAILDIQAPWSRKEAVDTEAAGHYVMAYHADEEYIYFYDS